MSSQNIETVEYTEPFAKKLRLSFSEESDSTSTATSFSNETLEMSNAMENKIQNINMADIVLKTHDAINFDLKNLLNSHILGKAILLKYEKTKYIDNKDRNHLCDIIICHFLNEEKRLNNSTISILADKIVEIFKCEKRSTYFVSPIGKNKSRHNRPEVARGKLIDKHRNKLTMLRKTLKTSEVSLVEEKQSKLKLYYFISL